jgi:hypothetical protein
MEPRPLAATTIPVLFLLAALAGGWVFQSRQASTGRTALFAAAKRDTAARARGARMHLELLRVEVAGDVGRTVVVQIDPGMRVYREHALEWRRLPTGAWEGPLREIGVDPKLVPRR